MSLARLPPDIIRPILVHLDSKDYERLYNTFNRSLQRLLAFPGVIGLLQISSTRSDLSWRQVCFLRAVRNATRLEILSRLNWPLRLIPLIATLNPLELKLLYQLSNQGIRDILKKPLSSRRYVKAARYWTRANFPDFKRLTPRLQTLEFPESLDATTDQEHHFLRSAAYGYHEDGRYIPAPSKWQSGDYRFPKSLTALLIHEQSHGHLAALLTGLPWTLRSLTLLAPISSRLNAATLFDCFPQLERLQLAQVNQIEWKPTEPTTTLPASLSSLSLSVPNFNRALDFLHQVDPSRSNLAELEVKVKDRASGSVNVDFAALLPPTMQALRLFSKHIWNSLYKGITSFPPHLTALSVTLYALSPKATSSALHLLYALPSLVELCLIGPIRVAGTAEAGNAAHKPALVTSLLPRSLTSLSVPEESINASALSHLPLKLSSLTVYYFRLENLPTFRLRHPSCHVTFELAHCLWESSMETILPKSALGDAWRSSVDMSLWAPAILEKHALDRITLRLWLLSDEDSVSTAPLVDNFSADACDPFFTRLCEWTSSSTTRLLKSLPNLRTLKLKSFNTSEDVSFGDFHAPLTHLEIDNPSLALHHLPPLASSALTFISTTCKLKASQDVWFLPKTLTHLNAPNWIVNYSTLSQWSLTNFKKFCIHLIGIMDWQIPRLIEGKNFDAQTRFNMRLKISYGLSGLVVPSQGFEDVDLDKISKHTVDWLKSQLHAPAPRDPSLSGKKSTNAILNDSVLEYTWKDKLTSSSLFFTDKVRSITINPHLDFVWQLGSAHLVGDLPPFHMFGVSSDMRTLQHLQRLSIANALPGAPLFTILPSNLKFLRITSEKMYDLGSVLPPTLEALSIKQRDGYSQYRYRLTFQLCALPSTLKYLAIRIDGFRLHSQDETAGERFKPLQLPNLKLLLLAGLSLTDALICRERFPIASTEHHHMHYSRPQDDVSPATHPAEIPGSELSPIFGIKQAKHEMLDFWHRLEYYESIPATKKKKKTKKH